MPSMPGALLNNSLIFSHRDLANIDSTDPTVRHALANAIRDACINVGFLYGKISSKLPLL